MPQATLLVVDDEPLNVSLLSQLLRPEFRVLGALSGASALALMAGEHPDLVLLDVMLPAMDGLAVLRQMRSQPALAAIPVIFVTALGAEFDEEKGLALGAADYIVKPIKPAVLLARVRAHLALRQAQARLADQNAWLEQELARRIRSLASAEQGGHVIPLQTTPFEYPDGRVRLGGLCLQQGGGGWAR